MCSDGEGCRRHIWHVIETSQTDRIIITHGTDTIRQTASYLSGHCLHIIFPLFLNLKVSQDQGEAGLQEDNCLDRIIPA